MTKIVAAHKYDSARSQIRTGDLVFFWGKTLISKILRKAQGAGAPSHVGMLLRVNIPFDVIFIVESVVFSRHVDILTGRMNHGVRIVQFSARSVKYDGQIAISHLNKPLSDEMEASIADILKDFRGKSYERKIKEFILAAMGFSQGDNLDYLFCSELCSELIRRIGIADLKRGSNGYGPIHLLPERIHKEMDFLDSYGYSPLIRLTF